MQYIFIILYGLLLSLTAAAQINIAIHGNIATVDGMSSQPGGTVVDTSVETWNNAGGINVSGMTLSNASGAATTATLSYAAGFLDSSNDNGWNTGSQDLVMMDAWAGFKGTESLTVSGLPAEYSSGYTVVIYGDSNEVNRTMNYTVDDGIHQRAATIQDSGTFSGEFEEGLNYAVFRNLTGSSFIVTGNTNTSGPRSSVNGIQIYSGVVPFIDNFKVNDGYVDSGTQTTLSWTAIDATSLTISPDVGDVTGLSSVSLTPTETTTYTLTASNDNNTRSQKLKVNVGPKRPNVIIILVDDYGPMDTSEPFAYDSYTDGGTPVITAFNNFYQTPNVELLADNGVKFTQAYALPVCSPTRTTLMTGYNSPRHGVTVYLNEAREIDDIPDTNQPYRSPNNWRYLGMETTDVTLPKLLGSVGYRTIHCGKAHIGTASQGTDDPRGIGFDINIGGSQAGQPTSYFGTNNYGVSWLRPIPGLEAYHGTNTFLTKALTLELNKAIEESVNDGVPFFAYMSYYAVHAPFTINPDAKGDYSTGYNLDHIKFATMVEGVDISVGDIIAKLTELEVASDTLILFMGDNGSDSPALTNESYAIGSDFDDYPIRGKKGSKYEGGSRIPLIVSWAQPDANNTLQQILPIPAGNVEHDIVSVIDIAPTILSAANVSTPAMDGYDLSPYMRAEAGSHRPQKLLTFMPHRHRSQYFMWLREDAWKLIYNFNNDDFELYNLTDDPDESDNLKSDQPERVLTMARSMAQELDESWGIYGKLWPTLNPDPTRQATISTRPYPNDPFVIPFNIDGRDLVDTDMDGLTDASEDTNGDGLLGTAETSADTQDTDKDGSDDHSERRLNLDPRNPNSAFRLEALPVNTSTIRLRWPSAPGTNFKVYSTNDLAATPIDWSIYSNVMGSENSETVHEVNVEEDQEFFKVELLDN